MLLFVPRIRRVDLCDIQRLDGVLKVDVSPIVGRIRKNAYGGQPVLLAGVAPEAGEGAFVVAVDDDARLSKPLLPLPLGFPIAPFHSRRAAWRGCDHPEQADRTHSVAE